MAAAELHRHVPHCTPWLPNTRPQNRTEPRITLAARSKYTTANTFAALSQDRTSHWLLRLRFSRFQFVGFKSPSVVMSEGRPGYLENLFVVVV
eukprot:2255331-Rhodomonas_salina.1